MSNNFELNPEKRSDLSGPNPLEAVNKLSGMDREKHERMVKAAIKGLKLEDHALSDYELLMQEGSRRMKNVRDWASLEVQASIAKAKDTTSGEFRAYLARNVMDKLTENYSHYSKDQLVCLLVNFGFNVIMKEVL